MSGKSDLPASIVYKIASAPVWEAAVQRGAYEGSTDDVRDGFIHLSTAKQLAGTLAKHYRGREDLTLIALKTSALGAALRWEPSRGGDLFPHLYAPLPASSVIWTRSLMLGQDSIPVVPEDLPG